MTLIVLGTASLAMIIAGHEAGGAVGLACGIGLSVLGLIAWLLALRDFRASPRDTFDAARHLVRGRDGPSRPRP